MSALKYLGWGRFTSTGQAYREWQFEEDVPELKAKKRWELVDSGPSEEPRFMVWDTAKHACSSEWNSEDVYARIKAIKTFRWQPPREGEEKIVKAIKGLTSYLKGFAVGQQSAAEETLRKMEALIDQARGEMGGTTGTPEPDGATQNDYLRLTRAGSYSNTGESFKIWELKVDVPTLPIDGHMEVGGKRHAQVGDELWEKTDDGEPFRLKRDESEVGNPEWWQVRHLFVGLRDGVEEEDVVDETPPKMRAVPLIRGLSLCTHLVERDIPEVGIKAGDVIVHAWNPKDFPEMGGRVRYLSMDDYATLREAALDSFDETFTFLAVYSRPEYHRAAGDLYKFLRSQNKWGKKLKVWHSRLAVVRSSRSPVSEPIAAATDNAALFELIYSTGGRMPEEASS